MEADVLARAEAEAELHDCIRVGHLSIYTSRTFDNYSVIGHLGGRLLGIVIE